VRAEDYLRAVSGGAEAFSSAARATELSAAVPACPDWTMADLIWHLGEVQHFWTQIVDRRLQSPDQVAREHRPADPDLGDWFDRVAARLVEALGGADPDTEVWTWSDQHSVGWVQRRMAQETAVHRWDAQSAGGGGEPIAADLAVDGVDEFVRFMVPDGPPVLDQVRLTASEGGQWDLGPAGGRRVELAGGASDLLLVLWRRLPLERIEVRGDPEAARAFVGHTELE